MRVLDWRVAFWSRVVHLGTSFPPQLDEVVGGGGVLLCVLYMHSAARSWLCGAICPGYEGVGSQGGNRSISSVQRLWVYTPVTFGFKLEGM